jgi:hypothetical protein
VRARKERIERQLERLLEEEALLKAKLARAAAPPFEAISRSPGAIESQQLQERVASQMLQLAARDVFHLREEHAALMSKEARLDKAELLALQERRRKGSAGRHRATSSAALQSGSSEAAAPGAAFTWGPFSFSLPSSSAALSAAAAAAASASHLVLHQQPWYRRLYLWATNDLVDLRSLEQLQRLNPSRGAAYEPFPVSPERPYPLVERGVRPLA